MSERATSGAAPPRGFASRAGRALALFFGAAALGPLPPAIFLFVVALLADRFGLARTPAHASVLSGALGALRAVVLGGGGAAAVAAGLALAALMLWKGRVGPLAASRAAALSALAASLWAVRTPSLWASLAVTLVLILVAVATARALFLAAASWRILP